MGGLKKNKMLCCTLCGSGVCREMSRANHCEKGVLYQCWGLQGVIPSQIRQSIYDLGDLYDSISQGRRGYEDYRVVCCACHLASDYHLNRLFYQTTACARCKVAVESGYRNIRHHARVLKMVMR